MDPPGQVGAASLTLRLGQSHTLHTFSDCVEDVFICLSVRVQRLYRSLEDYDVVRGIFGGKIGTKAITCTALDAEANNDFAVAVKIYNEVTLSL